MENYAALSIETHLFFARIMKEHSLFLEAGFPCKDEEWIQRADWFREQFEELLREVVELAEGRVCEGILESGELITEFTLPAERKTERLSGAAIDSRITMAEQRLIRGRERHGRENQDLFQKIRRINARSMRLLNGLIRFKEGILREVAEGSLFTANYPLLVEHILREARLYRAMVGDLMRNRRISRRHLRETEEFWNRIMMEHALFIRGLLDPTQEALIDTADSFAMDYRKLLEMARTQDEKAEEVLLRKKSLEETLKYREFKEAGTEGILDGKIASIILPLLADHVLREANHYIRILRSQK